MRMYFWLQKSRRRQEGGAYIHSKKVLLMSAHTGVLVRFVSVESCREIVKMAIGEAVIVSDVCGRRDVGRVYTLLALSP